MLCVLQGYPGFPGYKGIKGEKGNLFVMNIKGEACSMYSACAVFCQSSRLKYKISHLPEGKKGYAGRPGPVGFPGTNGRRGDFGNPGPAGDCGSEVSG